MCAAGEKLQGLWPQTSMAEPDGTTAGWQGSKRTTQTKISIDGFDEAAAAEPSSVGFAASYEQWIPAATGISARPLENHLGLTHHYITDSAEPFPFLHHTHDQ